MGNELQVDSALRVHACQVLASYLLRHADNICSEPADGIHWAVPAIKAKPLDTPLRALPLKSSHMHQEGYETGLTRPYMLSGVNRPLPIRTMLPMMQYVQSAMSGMYRSGAFTSCRGDIYLWPPDICSTHATYRLLPRPHGCIWMLSPGDTALLC